MKRIPFLRLAVAAAALLLIATGVRAADPLLSVVPRDTEIVVGINVPQILDSDFFQKIRKTRPRLLAQLNQQSQRMGVDIEKDVDNIYLFGRIGSREMGGLIVTGKIDQAKLIGVLRVYADYQTSQVSGMTIHEWFDRGVGKKKYATFMPDGPVIFWNSKEILDASLEAIRNDLKSLLSLPEAKQLPAESNHDAVWILLSNRLNRVPIPAQYQFASLMAVFTLMPKDLNIHVLIQPMSDDAKQQWLTSIRQMLLAMQFMEENEMAQELAFRSDIKGTEGGRSIDFKSKVNLDVIMETVGYMISLRQ